MTSGFWLVCLGLETIRRCREHARPKSRRYYNLEECFVLFLSYLLRSVFLSVFYGCGLFQCTDASEGKWDETAKPSINFFHLQTSKYISVSNCLQLLVYAGLHRPMQWYFFFFGSFVNNLLYFFVDINFSFAFTALSL